MLILWYTFLLMSLFINSALTTRIISKIYLLCSFFFVSHLIFLIVISEYMSLLILISVFAFFFSMSLDISLILILCTITLKLTSRRLAFNDIFLIQKSFSFSIFLLSFILTQNMSRFDCLFIIFMSLRVDSISSTLLSLAYSTMFFVVIIMILFIFSFSLMKIFTLSFLQWFCTDNDMLMLRARWFLNDVINFSLILFVQLSTHLFSFMNFFSSLHIIFFSLFNWFFIHQLIINALTRWCISFSVIFISLLIFFQSISSLFLRSLSS